MPVGVAMIRAGLTIVPVVPWERAARRQGGGDQLPNFYHAVLTFERSSVGLNVTTTTTKKVVNFLRRKSAARPEKKVRAQRKSACPEKILAARMRKGPPPDVGMGPTNG